MNHHAYHPTQSSADRPRYGTTVRPGNGWAVAALVTGLAGFCVPAVGGLLAILFGALGVRRSAVVRAGRGMSVAGLSLGVLSAGAWVLTVAAAVVAVRGTAINRDIARRFVADLAAGDRVAAAAAVDPAQIDSAELDALAATINKRGSVQDVSAAGYRTFAGTGEGGVEIVGIVVHPGGKQLLYTMRQARVGDQWKVVEFRPTP